jgi:hypothetical protein
MASQCELCGMPGKRTEQKASGETVAEVIDLVSSNDDTSKSAKQLSTTRASRKRKAPPPTRTSNTFFGENQAESLSSSSTQKPVVTTSAMATKTVSYLHSLSYNVLPKRSPQEAQRDTRKALESIFQLKQLRNLQPQAVSCALQLQSQMIVMATGGGK